MVSILISGIMGHMGRNVLELAQADSAVKVPVSYTHLTLPTTSRV